MKRRRPKLPRTCPKCGDWGGRGLWVRVHRGGRAYQKPRGWWLGAGRKAEDPARHALRVYYPLAQHRDLWRVCDDPWHERFRKATYPDPTPAPPVSVDPLPKETRTERTKTKKVEHKVHQGKDRR